jgi:hypothetical protein
MVAIKVADRAKQNGVRRLGYGNSFRRERMAGGTPGGGSDQTLSQFKTRQVKRMENANRLSGNFGTDSVPGKDSYFHGARLGQSRLSGNGAMQSFNQSFTHSEKTGSPRPTNDMVRQRFAVATQGAEQVTGRLQIVAIA